MTNFEKIKNMRIDEMAEKLHESFACDRCPIGKFCDKHNSTLDLDCTGVWREWLKSEGEGGRMKSVVISIRPEWCEKIASGKKTIEVRKTAPKEVPFKCYIYCAASNVHDALVVGGGEAKLIHCGNYKSAIPVGGAIGNGKVIGEFICKCVQKITTMKESCFGTYFFEDFYNIRKNDLQKACLNHTELWEYGKGKTLYGWHISDLKIYDKPVSLKELAVIKPPQSWIYMR